MLSIGIYLDYSYWCKVTFPHSTFQNKVMLMLLGYSLFLLWNIELVLFDCIFLRTLTLLAVRNTSPCPSIHVWPPNEHAETCTQMYISALRVIQMYINFDMFTTCHLSHWKTWCLFSFLSLSLTLRSFRGFWTRERRWAVAVLRSKPQNNQHHLL